MLKGKVAVVTGSTSGIGLGVARALVVEDCAIAVSTPDSIGALTVFLCGDAAATITGSAYSIDGGWVAQ